MPTPVPPDKEVTPPLGFTLGDRVQVDKELTLMRAADAARWKAHDAAEAIRAKREELRDKRDRRVNWLAWAAMGCSVSALAVQILRLWFTLELKADHG